MPTQSQFEARKVAGEPRFAFGQNWRKFLAALNEERILEAEKSLCVALECDSLAGQSFLDLGSGSGLFSLAARRLGARVHSVDYDPDAVKCTSALRHRYFRDDPHWTVAHGSVLDLPYLQSLGTFDIVYSWGVLHHTGAMWQALEHACVPVSPDGGTLFISIYNDQGRRSRIWRRTKRLYNQMPRVLRFTLLVPELLRAWGPSSVVDLLRGHPFEQWRTYSRNRGMSAWRDVVDWVGGYPFEVAKPEEIFAFCRRRGFTLEHLKTWGRGHGCNEYVFRFAGAHSAAQLAAPTVIANALGPAPAGDGGGA
jgi:2-polyprenyl-6-hydroxyphenyl methylase/3-demethylubiquinone-9 3-methyltransferase